MSVEVSPDELYRIMDEAAPALGLLGGASGNGASRHTSPRPRQAGGTESRDEPFGMVSPRILRSKRYEYDTHIG